MSVVAESADANFAVHSTWGLRGLPGASIVEDDTLTITDSGLPCDTFNIVCRARLDSPGAVRRSGETIDYFRRSDRGFSWWVGPADTPAGLGQVLVEAGLRHAESETAMSLSLSRLREPEVPRGLEIRRVSSPADLDIMAHVMAGLSTPPDTEVVRFYRLALAKLLAPDSPQRYYVGFYEGRPVGTAEVTLAGGVAGIYGIVTQEQYRGRGIGSALTARPLLDARSDGCRTGVLQASAAGTGVYRRLGFQEFGEIHEYKPA